MWSYLRSQVSEWLFPTPLDKKALQLVEAKDMMVAQIFYQGLPSKTDEDKKNQQKFLSHLLLKAAELDFSEGVKFALNGTDAVKRSGIEIRDINLAFEFALSHTNLIMARYLVEAGVEIDNPLRKNYFKTNLIFSIKEKQEAKLKLLLELGCDVTKGFGFYSPLMAAVTTKQENLLALLLEYGLKADRAKKLDMNLDGGRALWLAAAAGSLNIVKMLLAACASTENRSPSSALTAREIALKNGYTEIAELIAAKQAASLNTETKPEVGSVMIEESSERQAKPLQFSLKASPSKNNINEKQPLVFTKIRAKL